MFALVASVPASNQRAVAEQAYGPSTARRQTLALSEGVLPGGHHGDLDPAPDAPRSERRTGAHLPREADAYRHLPAVFRRQLTRYVRHAPREYLGEQERDGHGGENGSD